MDKIKIKTILLNPLIWVSIILLFGEFDFKMFGASDELIYVVEFFTKILITVAIIINPEIVTKAIQSKQSKQSNK